MSCFYWTGFWRLLRARFHQSPFSRLRPCTRLLDWPWLTYFVASERRIFCQLSFSLDRILKFVAITQSDPYNFWWKKQNTFLLADASNDSFCYDTGCGCSSCGCWIRGVWKHIWASISWDEIFLFANFGNMTTWKGNENDFGFLQYYTVQTFENFHLLFNSTSLFVFSWTFELLSNVYVMIREQPKLISFSQTYRMMSYDDDYKWLVLQRLSGLSSLMSNARECTNWARCPTFMQESQVTKLFNKLTT